MNKQIGACVCDFFFFFFRQLSVTVDAKDDNYMPHHIIVMGGDSANLKQLNEVFIDM